MNSVSIDKAVIEQAEQEPVAEIEVSYTEISGESIEVISCELDAGIHKLYAAPVRTKDLTDDEIEWLVVDTLETWNSKDTMKDFARAVIAAYKAKQNQ